MQEFEMRHSVQWGTACNEVGVRGERMRAIPMSLLQNKQIEVMRNWRPLCFSFLSLQGTTSAPIIACENY
eukprot:61049-Pelagomonas_calceolata.AAC.2